MAGDHSLKNVKTKNKFPCPHYLPVHPPQITTNTIKLVPSHQENSGTTLSWVSKQPYKPIHPQSTGHVCGILATRWCSTAQRTHMDWAKYPDLQYRQAHPGHSYIYIYASCSVVSNSATPWTVAHQAPLSKGFSRQEYWSGLPFPSPQEIVE